MRSTTYDERQAAKAKTLWRKHQRAEKYQSAKADAR